MHPIGAGRLDHPPMKWSAGMFRKTEDQGHAKNDSTN